jgi:DNA-binding transcriptional ArsR family regulator
MVELFFTTEDVARTRFAFSALGETVQSVRVLRDPGAYPIHVPWIREALLERPGSTSDLAEHLDRSPPAISQHLGVLREAGLVVGRRDGRHVIYALTDTGERLLRGACETPGT